MITMFTARFELAIITKCVSSPSSRFNLLFSRNISNKSLSKTARNNRYTMISFANGSGKQEALRSEIEFAALLKDVRKSSLAILNSTASHSARKKRCRKDVIPERGLSAMPGNNEKRACWSRRSVSPTFWNLIPPSATALDDNVPEFTFGKEYYSSISLPTLSKDVSCGCQAGSNAFDVFSSYHCPCKKSRTSSAATKKSHRGASALL